MHTTKKQINADLGVVLITVIMLLIIGSIFVYSASSVYALEHYGSAYYYLKRQCFGICLGIIAFFGIQLISLRTIKKYTPLIFLASLGTTALTLLTYTSKTIHGSSRWLRIAGFSFQPSELIKIGLILYVAYFLDRRKQVTNAPLGQYAPLLIGIALTSIILLKQPDFGLTVTLLATVVCMLFVAQVQLKHLMIALGALIPLCIILIIMRPYRLQRVLTFLNPWRDPQGAGFQIIQSLIAIGSGGLGGVGIGQSRQKFFYLPMQHTDFIFSILAEESGLIGCLFVLTILIAFTYCGLKIATQLHDKFAALVTLGFITLMSLQSCINIAVASGLLPTKGIGLPFISYGNSALIVALAMIGLIVSFVKQKEAINT